MKRRYFFIYQRKIVNIIYYTSGKKLFFFFFWRLYNKIFWLEMKHRGWLKIGRDNFDRSEIWMECAQKRTARRKSDMENYAAVESVSAGSWNDCFSSSFISASHHARFPCKRRGPATRRAWSKSNQLDFKLSVTLAAFFHPPSLVSPSSYFPFHHRDLMHLKCVSKISSLIFFKKKTR